MPSCFKAITGRNVMLSQSRQVILITGLAGAGKSTALQVFEDLGYLTASGLPLSLLRGFCGILNGEDTAKYRGIAVILENREIADERYLRELLAVKKALADDGIAVSILFLEAQDQVILRRYATTRRPHPMERSGFGLEQAMREEKKGLRPLRDCADIVIDTSNCSLHDLRRELQHRTHSAHKDEHPMRIALISFGFKFGVPLEADFVFDMRCLPNPHFDENLRPLTGQDSRIADFIFADEASRAFLDKFIEYITFIAPYYESEGRYRICFAIGCTGGRHRSVAVTEALAKALKAQGYSITTEHRHLHLV